MRILIFILLLVVAQQVLFAQDPTNPVVEQQLENLSEAEDSETEDDSYLQQLNHYRREPLNLNTATENDFTPFRFITELQIQQFLRYRQLLGALVSIYELQAIPGWDIESINRLMPFVRVGPATSVLTEFSTRLRNGDKSFLARVTQVIEQSRGYKAPNDSVPARYPGGPQRVYLRYKYQYKNLLQYGIVGDKDAGEQFFKGPQKYGFDFYSFHLFIRNLGIVKRIALGDFTVNMAQGLLSYQSLAFRKSVDVMNIKRQTEVFRPYNSAAEYNFHRGAAITIGKQSWTASAFVSRQRITANAVNATDTLNDDDEIISSFNTSGLHRTSGEIADRYNTLQTGAGLQATFKKNGFYSGVQAVAYHLDKPFERQNEPYNKFAFSGKTLRSASAELSYTWRNIHAFTEVANNLHKTGGSAMVAGVMASIDPRVDVSLLYRNLDANFHSIYGRAFTESTTPNNEKGLYMGLSVRPWGFFRFDGYADFFSFPWLRYQVDRPSNGSDFLVQFTYKPNKQFEIYTRYKAENKALNRSGNILQLPVTDNVTRQNWRTHFSYKINTAFTVRGRSEIMWFDKEGPQQAQGFLLFGDVFYKPLMSRYALNCRLQYFETDDYNSRIYAYENDILYSYSIPAFAGKGYRYYLNVNYDVTRKLTAYLRLAQTRYTDREVVGSGNDETKGNHRTDYRLQLIYRW